MNDEVAQVLGGLNVGADVVIHPGDTLEEGSLVTRRDDLLTAELMSIIAKHPQKRACYSTQFEEVGQMHIRSLSTLECTKLLSASRLGRLACAKDGHPYVVPFYFAYADHHLYAFSMSGKKIDFMRANPQVAVLVEKHEKGREWQSVIVDGRYEELPDRIGHKLERDHAWSLLSRYVDWWEPGALKTVTPPLSDHSDHVFFRILIDEISGREAKEGM